MPEVTGDVGLAEFQNENCKGCFWADDEKVGTGEPCCLKPTYPHAERRSCLDKKPEGGDAYNVQNN